MAILKDTVTNEAGQQVTVYIEVDEAKVPHSPYGETRGPGFQGKDVKDALEKAMELVRTCAEQVAGTVQKIPEKMRPAGCEVLFAIKFDTEVGAMIAKVSTEAQLQVTLKWGEVSQ